MTVHTSDIVMVYTGGSVNTDPRQSLGGNPSSQPVTGLANNLFTDITDAESISGIIDYRCVYIFNNNLNNALYNVRIFTNEESVAIIDLGIQKQLEIQNLALNRIATGGYLTISYPGKPSVSVNWDADLSTLATNIQHSLNAIFESTLVTVSGNTFNIKFNGSDDYRFHDILTVNTSNLTPINIVASVSRIAVGQPINYIPDILESNLTTPAGVDFIGTTSESPIVIGTLNALEGFPLWLRRTCVAGTKATQADNLSLTIQSSPIP